MNILLVEDNPGDVRLTEEALKESHVMYQLHVVPDGESALRYLSQQGEYADSVRPDIIFLDLNLPMKDGREVLAELKRNGSTKMIPVVVLTTSESQRDIIESYERFANCYITKPVDINQFIDVIKSIEKFWFNTVLLPQGTY